MLAGLENCYEVGPGRCGKVLGIDEPPPLRVEAKKVVGNTHCIVRLYLGR